MRMCFSLGVGWWGRPSLLEEFAISMQNGVDPFVSVIPFAAVVKYPFKSSERG